MSQSHAFPSRPCPLNRYVQCLNLTEDPEYVQNTQFSVDLRQKQLEVQNEVWVDIVPPHGPMAGVVNVLQVNSAERGTCGFLRVSWEVLGNGFL